MKINSFHYVISQICLFINNHNYNRTLIKYIKHTSFCSIDLSHSPSFCKLSSHILLEPRGGRVREFSVPQIEYLLGGSSIKVSHVYFLL